MFCSKCGKANGDRERFCRNCGNDLPELSLTTTERRIVTAKDRQLMSRDQDELAGKGVGKVIIGDGFFIVAAILAATTSSVSSMLWLVMLIPAFFFFGTGFADVFQARQIRRRRKGLSGSSSANQLSPPSVSAIEAFGRSISGELVPASVTDRTTRDLNT